jgi:SAM-dependent methyltransferase
MSAFTRQAVSDLEDYQQRFVQAVSRVIAGNWLLKRPAIRILDMGCDCSGRQLREIVKLIGGTAVGVNIPPDFPSRKAVAAAGDRVQLLRMDGMQLQFPDESFDLVVSANVIEHVPDPVRFIREAARVLKPDGVCYMETAPVWSGPRGHHIMESMIAENCPEESRFRDDGTVIPDWAHLTLSKAEMAELLRRRLLPGTCSYILDFLYDSPHLNRQPWSVINSGFDSGFPFVRMHSRGFSDADPARMPADGREDYSIYGFDAVCRKRRQSRLHEKCCRLLRRVGL